MDAMDVVGVDERFKLIGLHKIGVEGVTCFTQRLFSREVMPSLAKMFMSMG